MHQWIATSASAERPPKEIRDIVVALEAVGAAMRATEAPGGGLKRPALRQVVAGALDEHTQRDAKAAFAARELDFLLPSQKVAVSVQAGRALTNNGALLAVLAAAAEDGVDWLLTLVPFIYKSGAQFAPVVDQLGALIRSRGIRLELHGVAVVAY